MALLVVSVGSMVGMVMMVLKNEKKKNLPVQVKKEEKSGDDKKENQ